MSKAWRPRCWRRAHPAHPNCNTSPDGISSWYIGGPRWASSCWIANRRSRGLVSTTQSFSQLVDGIVVFESGLEASTWGNLAEKWLWTWSQRPDRYLAARSRRPSSKLAVHRDRLATDQPAWGRSQREHTSRVVGTRDGASSDVPHSWECPGVERLRHRRN